MKLLEHFTKLSLHPKNAEELKGLILQLAVKGKLTSDWRMKNSDVQTTSELLDEIAKEKVILLKEKKIKKEKPVSSVEENDIPFEIPITWDWCRFQNIVYSGYTGIERSRNMQSLDYSFGYFKMNNIGNHGKCNWDKLVFVEASNDEIEKYKLKVNDFLFNTRNSYELVGKTCVIDKATEKPVLFNNNIFKVDFGGKNNPEYVNLMFSSPTIKDLLDEKKSATTNVAAIYQGKLMELLVVIPPIEEQKAIVEVVTQLFKEVEQLEDLTKQRITLKEDFVTSVLQRLTQADNTTQEWNFLQQHFSNFFTEKANIKKLRETILQLAVQGKLTAQWRKDNPTSEPASESLKRIEAEKQQLIAEKKIKKEKPLLPIKDEDIPHDLPEGWGWCRLRDLVSLLGDGIHGTPTYTPNGPVHFVNGNNLNDGVIEIKETTKTVSEEEASKHYRNLNSRTVLVSINGSIGYTAFYNGEKIMLGKSACYFNLLNEINKEYIRQLIKSEYFRDYAFESASGTTIKNVSLKTMRAFVVPLPSLEEQEVLVRKVHSLMTLCDELEQQIDNSQAQIEQLMQSCLKEVFEKA